MEKNKNPLKSAKSYTLPSLSLINEKEVMYEDGMKYIYEESQHTLAPRKHEKGMWAPLLFSYGLAPGARLQLLQLMYKHL